MSYEQAVKWQKKHRKQTLRNVIMSTGSGFWPSGAFLREDYGPYVEECNRQGKEPMSCEAYYHRMTTSP